MADDLGERTEEATPKRRVEAREEGNIARSQDLSSALMLLAVTVTLWVLVMPMLRQAKVVMETALGGDMPLNPADAWEAARYVGGAGIRVAAPVLVITWVVAYVVHLMQVGWLISPKALQPKLSKLNPMSGFKRIFGLSGLVKVSLDTLKVAAVATVAVWTIMQHRDEITVLPYLTAMQALGRGGWLLLDLAMRVLAVLLLLGLLDFLYQRWKYRQDLKMTKQQVKDELKQTEGDPLVKRRRLRMQQQIAMQRISAAVPRANVVVTNPEHVAVAIQYEAQTMNAPKVVAKGAELLALRIRQIAVRHGIPVVERKSLARALYRQVAVGQEIPADFYKAVAEILAYVYRLNPSLAGSTS